ncbi:hypothetical protein TVAG_497980 [Trichomonas vaginalis G3]|uniref:Uncharacterized protein n=1 Tax=Trichomonas vaginalis (strain ATCC PRA-98 / G3) TaxID=412133 RepID=A2FVB7_TRIV3|nr:beta1,3-galactosyltransferase family [Trichomonas vaginalis G3]EAX91157.1 hypothetical protein TVAG_497980 [Trichomonas vaginalis G3]KAI5547099.1 beta1,3-galactosyltransferase family [Trichomonas vaginalis G3]|eukprot:XP_001304087.1 hypothetical protein [Trichomonas vaginalis G3]
MIVVSTFLTSASAVYFRFNSKPLTAKRQNVYYNTSVAFYVIVGASHKIPPDEDLRGKFWEWQLPYKDLNATVDYVSDGPVNITGIPALVPGVNPNARFDDRQFCIRAPYTWKHFVEKHGEARWYFRGIHDTFVNMSGLVETMKNLESQLDPMKEFGFAYNVHEYGYQLYPHGGAGYLFSNYAVKKFHENAGRFNYYCHQIADDVGLAPFMRDVFGLDVTKYISKYFITTWPNTENDIIFKKEYYKVGQCPPYYQLYNGAAKLTPCPAHSAVSLHMHKVNMKLALDLIQQTPEEFSVTYPNPSTPTFCKN